jgi:hypothetical protein
MFDDDSVSEASDDDDMDDDKPKKDKNSDAELIVESIPVRTTINRIRSMNYTNIVAAWGENGKVMIFDVKNRMDKLEKLDSI